MDESGVVLGMLLCWMDGIMDGGIDATVVGSILGSTDGIWTLVVGLFNE